MFKQPTFGQFDARQFLWEIERTIIQSHNARVEAATALKREAEQGTVINHDPNEFDRARF